MGPGLSMSSTLCSEGLQPCPGRTACPHRHQPGHHPMGAWILGSLLSAHTICIFRQLQGLECFKPIPDLLISINATLPSNHGDSCVFTRRLQSLGRRR